MFGADHVKVRPPRNYVIPLGGFHFHAGGQFLPDHLPVPPRYTLTLDEGAHPRTLTMAVSVMVQREETTVLGKVVGLYVRIEIDAGHEGRPTTYFLSRLEGELGWVIDAKFGPDGYPHYAHGFGERLSAGRMVIKQVAEILDDLALASGLAKEIGEETPLVLAPRRSVTGPP
jgi:hypothetical protein